jgi:hypothetical protein
LLEPSQNKEFLFSSQRNNHSNRKMALRRFHFTKKQTADAKKGKNL